MDKNLLDRIQSGEKIPVERGCSNKVCFCTGVCKQIIGWYVDGKFVPDPNANDNLLNIQQGANVTDYTNKPEEHRYKNFP